MFIKWTSNSLCILFVSSRENGEEQKLLQNVILVIQKMTILSITKDMFECKKFESYEMFINNLKKRKLSKNVQHKRNHPCKLYSSPKVEGYYYIPYNVSKNNKTFTRKQCSASANMS